MVVFYKEKKKQNIVVKYIIKDGKFVGDPVVKSCVEKDQKEGSNLMSKLVRQNT